MADGGKYPNSGRGYNVKRGRWQEQKQVKHINCKEDEKSIYCQGKIEAFNQALNLLADFEKYIERYTCREVQELNNTNINRIL